MSAVSNGLSEDFAISRKTYECVRMKQRRDKGRREMSNQRGIRIIGAGKIKTEASNIYHLTLITVAIWRMCAPGLLKHWGVQWVISNT